MYFFGIRWIKFRKVESVEKTFQMKYRLTPDPILDLKVGMKVIRLIIGAKDFPLKIKIDASEWYFFPKAIYQILALFRFHSPTLYMDVTALVILISSYKSWCNFENGLISISLFCIHFNKTEFTYIRNIQAVS